MLNRLEEAQELSDALLTDIELSQLKPMDIIRKASRLARLMDDVDASKWLRYEVVGFNKEQKDLDGDSWQAAQKSGRTYLNGEETYANTSSIGALQADIESAKLRLSKLSGAEFTINTQASALRTEINQKQAFIDRIIGAVFDWVATSHLRLRFGSSVESAFETLRKNTDTLIAETVPEVLPKITTAFENASTDDPEQWKNAAGACRELMIELADNLYSAGPDKDGRKMGKTNYVNRLVAWIDAQSGGTTIKSVVKADVEYFGKRIDAYISAGNKGRHAQEISRVEASRFITGTYILVHDILSLKGEVSSAN